MRSLVKKILILISIVIAETILISWMQLKIKNNLSIQQQEKENAYFINQSITQDIKCFPVALKYRGNVSFEDGFGAYRENGDHEGCDIMYDANTPGVVPIVSATDGIITNLGWLHLGGYRIGITTENGIYYYYAHFDSYAQGLYIGKNVRSGEFLGFMGNTGEGEEGTSGKFPVHLHFGIYIKDENGNEESVNPYPYLLKINTD